MIFKLQPNLYDPTGQIKFVAFVMMSDCAANDAVVSDVELNGEGSTQLLKYLRELERNGKAPE